VNRLVLETFCGSQPHKQTRHLNGVKTDNRISNLKWGTAAENAEDRIRHGTAWRPIGEKHPAAVLNDAIVLEMRLRHSKGESIRSIAKSLGVKYWTTHNAITGRNWGHLPCQHA